MLKFALPLFPSKRNKASTRVHLFHLLSFMDEKRTLFAELSDSDIKKLISILLRKVQNSLLNLLSRVIRKLMGGF